MFFLTRRITKEAPGLSFIISYAKLFQACQPDRVFTGREGRIGEKRKLMGGYTNE